MTQIEALSYAVEILSTQLDSCVNDDITLEHTEAIKSLTRLELTMRRRQKHQKTEVNE